MSTFLISAEDAKRKIDSRQARARFSVPQVDTVRVLAMAGIFMHHLWGADGGGGAIQNTIGLICYLGQFGVILFNIITGFVLALPYLGYEQRSVPQYLQFIKRRFLRIVPVYYLALFLFTGLNLLIFTPSEYASTFWRLTGNILFLQALDPSSLSTNMAAYWYLTLLTEFYLLFPLLLRFFQSFKPGPACIFLCLSCWGGLAMIDVLSQSSRFFSALAGSMIYFNLPARLPEFAIGMWLAQAWKPGALRSRGLPIDTSFLRFAFALLLFVVLCAPWIPKAPQSIGFIFEVSGSFILFIALFLTPAAARFGTSAMVRSVSAASYGIYLTHQPLFSYSNFFLGGNISSPSAFGLAAIILGPIAYLLARGLEILSTTLIRRFSSPRAQTQNQKAA